LEEKLKYWQERDEALRKRIEEAKKRLQPAWPSYHPFGVDENFPRSVLQPCHPFGIGIDARAEARRADMIVMKKRQRDDANPEGVVYHPCDNHAIPSGLA
jgi:hypothetical protein